MRAKILVSLEVTALTVGRKIVLVLWCKKRCVLCSPAIGAPATGLSSARPVREAAGYFCGDVGVLLYRLNMVCSVDGRSVLSALQSVGEEPHFPSLCHPVLSQFTQLTECLKRRCVGEPVS